MTKQKLLPIVFSLLTLTACSQQNTNGTGTSGNTGSHSGQATGNNGGATSGTIGQGGASGVNTHNVNGSHGGANTGNNTSNTNDISLAGLNDPNNLLSQRIIYFDYNKSSIRPEYMILIETHAQLLAKYPNLKMRLEGHADERGSREYNVALSESRAQSVKSIMGLQGALGNQIKTIGYGEEEPIASGHNQSSWQKNRRVEIKYEGH